MIAAKFHYNYWRPITAIRNGEADGNEATQPDPAWIPLIGTPNFPEYPCGHCTVAGAIAEVMNAEVGPRPAGGVRVGSLAVPLSMVQALPSWDEWEQQVSRFAHLRRRPLPLLQRGGQQIGRRAARR